MNGNTVIMLTMLACLALIGIEILVRRRFGAEPQYDERQLWGRGKAYQLGFFTLLALDLFCTIGLYLDVLPGEPLLWHTAAMVAGMTVFGVTAVHYDAYIALSENKDKIIWTNSLMTGWCLFLGVNNLVNVKNVTLAAFMFMVSGGSAVVLVTYLVHFFGGKDDEE